MTKTKNPVIKKNNRWYNTLTKKYVSSVYAKRINRYFELHPERSLYKAGGHGKYVKYDEEGKKVSLQEHAKDIKRLVFTKGTQLIKTKTKEGKIVYYSPFQDMRLSKEDMEKFKKLDYYICGKKAYVELYRMTMDRKSIYHKVKWKIDKTFRISQEIDTWEIFTHETFDCIVKEMFKIAKKYPLGRFPNMYGAVSVYIYTDLDGWNTGQSFGWILPDKTGYAPFMNDYYRILQHYKDMLDNTTYPTIVFLSISIYIWDFASKVDEKVLSIAKYRLGITQE